MTCMEPSAVLWCSSKPALLLGKTALMIHMTGASSEQTGASAASGGGLVCITEPVAGWLDAELAA